MMLRVAAGPVAALRFSSSSSACPAVLVDGRLVFNLWRTQRDSVRRRLGLTAPYGVG